MERSSQRNCSSESNDSKWVLEYKGYVPPSGLHGTHAKRGADLDFQEYLNTSPVEKIAVALDRRGPMTFRQFRDATGSWNNFAASMRDKMQAWGLITVDWKDGRTQMIALTPRGEAFVQITLQKSELWSDKAFRAKHEAEKAELAELRERGP